MSTTKLQSTSKDPPATQPGPFQPPAPSLPPELLLGVLEFASRDTLERHEPAEHQQTRNYFSRVCRSWYRVATSSPELVVEGAVKARRLATLLRTKQRTLPAVKTLQLIFVDKFNEWDLEEEPEDELYERRAHFADIVQACPNVEHLSLDMETEVDPELGSRLLDVLERCSLSTFAILGPCTMPERAMIRLMKAWPKLKQLDIPAVHLLCHRPRLSSPLTFNSLERLSFPIVRPNHLPFLGLILDSPSPPTLRVYKTTSGSNEWLIPRGRREAAALVDRVADQLTHFIYEHTLATGGLDLWAFEPVIARMANLRVLAISPNLIRLSPFLVEVVVPLLVHLERLGFPMGPDPNRHRGILTTLAVTHCINNHPHFGCFTSLSA